MEWSTIMSIVERIKKECQSMNIKVSFLEQQNGLSSGAISKWNTSSPSAENLYKIANYFNTSMEYLLVGKERTISFSDEELEWLLLYKKLSACNPDLIKECRSYIEGSIIGYQIGKKSSS